MYIENLNSYYLPLPFSSGQIWSLVDWSEITELEKGWLKKFSAIKILLLYKH